MTEEELKNYLKMNFPKENEEVEWKDFCNLKNNVSGRKSDDVISYISAISNQEGGFLIIGIEDKKHKIKGIQDFHDYTLENICSRILWNISGLHDLKIQEFKTEDTNKIVWIFDIPKHKTRTHIIAHNTFFLRKGDSLIDRGDELEHRKQEILKEDFEINKLDWSAEICEGATIDDLDEEAIAFLREKLVKAKGNIEFKTLEITNLLNRVNLLTEGKINNTCVLFLGKPEITDKYLMDKNKISWVWRDERNNFEERLSLDEIKKPFILLLPEIQAQIQRKNTYLTDLDLFREDIWQYDEKAVEEVLVNTIAHRDWEIRLWIEVVQTPIGLEIRNPGKFEADWDKALKYNEKPPYKNPNLVNFLNHIKLMEREGDGIRRVYKTQVSKGLEVIQRNVATNRVDFILTGKVKNVEFAKFVLARRGDIEIEDLRILEKIAKGENRLEKDISIQDYNRIKEFVKLHAPSKTLKVKSSTPKIPSEQILKSASMKTLEQHILDHARAKKDDVAGNYLEFYNSEIYDKLNSNKNTIRAILAKLVQKNDLIKTRDGCYKFNNKSKTSITVNKQQK